ncbi:hypothetical protein [Paenibacillus glucanolyticus]|uniref:hypothetical protein n=1 Tax=Paenibacillus glucanolyticus TaxID=59843 RepID=UPI00128B3256|nr:hypothetical protein [Paenibacillus glucanolyticus]MPY20679.1 hypothetical protein [Paenibacillus glucanolyticus]
MPDLDPEINERIEGLLNQEYITEDQSKVLKAYFMYGRSSKVASEKLNMHPTGFAHVTSSLAHRNILEKLGRGKFILADDESAFIMPFVEPEIPPDPPLNMTEQEKNWMLENYSDYRSKRSEAARILKRSKFDICRMAIELKLDAKR